MEKNFEKELPAGYREVYSIDAENNKIGLLMNGAALVLTAAIIALSVLVIRPRDFFGNYSLARNIILVVGIFAYLVLHELTHGLAYKCLTGQKLCFGISLTVAYCGVPDIYVYRRTALIALLAPFVVFGIVFLTGALALHDAWDKFYAMLMFALHFGGCVGDLYDTALYLFRFRDPATLMRDTGPMQTFYQKD